MRNSLKILWESLIKLLSFFSSKQLLINWKLRWSLVLQSFIFYWKFWELLDDRFHESDERFNDHIQQFSTAFSFSFIWQSSKWILKVKETRTQASENKFWFSIEVKRLQFASSAQRRFIFKLFSSLEIYWRDISKASFWQSFTTNTNLIYLRST